MDISFAISIVVMLVGLVLYWITAGKPQRIGEIMFAFGLLATLLKFAGHASVRIGS